MNDAAAYTPTWLDSCDDFFQGLPAAWILIGAIALLVLGGWIASRAWSEHLVLRALSTAQAPEPGQARGTVVKLVGRAQAPGGAHHSQLTNKRFVWRESSTFRPNGIRRQSRARSVARIIVATPQGNYLVDTSGAKVLYSTTASSEDSGSNSTTRTEYLILDEDPVFVIGSIAGALPSDASGEERMHNLRPTPSGVLLVSARSEQYALIYFRLRFWPIAIAAALCIGAALYGPWGHIKGYENQSPGEYLDALQTRPWTRYPRAG